MRPMRTSAGRRSIRRAGPAPAAPTHGQAPDALAGGPSEAAVLETPVLAHSTARTLRREALAGVQRVHGNRRTERALAGAVQRHPAGAGLSVDVGAAVEEIQSPAGDIVPLPAGKSGKAPPKSTSKPSMSLAQSQTVLQAAYGSVKTIVPGSIVQLDGRPALWAKYDEICIAGSVVNPRTTKPWKAGDAKKNIPTLEGFADKGTSYVNKLSPLSTVTAHEMLHNNTASDFRATVGETINEGMTERLAMRALAAAGIPAGSAEAYPQERSFVDLISPVVGEATLVAAYFNGAGTLVETLDALYGAGSFAKLKGAADALDTAAAKKLMTKKSAADKAAVIISKLGPTPDPAAMALIDRICQIDPADLAGIRVAVAPHMIALILGMLSPAADAAKLLAIDGLMASPAAEPTLIKVAISGHVITTINAMVDDSADADRLAAAGRLVGSSAVDGALVRAGVAPHMIEVINSLLDGWVSDSDLSAIERIFSCAAADRATIGAAISPRVKSLFSSRQRARLQGILGTV